MNKYSYWQQFFFATTDSGSTITTVFDALSLCTGCIFGYIAMEINNSIRYSDECQQVRSLAMS